MNTMNKQNVILLASAVSIIIVTGMYFAHKEISHLHKKIEQQEKMIQDHEQKDLVYQIIDPIKHELRQIKEAVSSMLQQKLQKLQRSSREEAQRREIQQEAYNKNNRQQAPLQQQPRSHNSAVIEINNQQDLQNLLDSNEEPSVLFFHMNGCGWCRKMDPIYDEVAANPEFKHIKFYKIEGSASQAPSLVDKAFGQRITGYPTLIFTNKDGYVDKQVGFSQKDDFQAKIKKYLQD